MTEVRTSPSAGREVARWSLLVFGVALALRGVLLFELSPERLFDLKLGDGRVYHFWAQKIAGGDWIGDTVFYQAPLYPYFVAVVYRIAGESLLMLRLIQIVIGATSCALLTQAGWRLFSSKWVGVGAGLALSCYPPVLFSDVSLQKSVLDVFFVCAILAVLSEIAIRGRPRLLPLLGLGVGLGALVLTRENTLVFAPVLAAWLALLPAEAPRARVLRVGLFAAGLVLVLMPVALRNWSISGDLHLTTSQFGHNLYIGNNPNADGTYQALLFARGEPLVERDDAVAIVERSLGRSATAAEVSDFYAERAFEYIRSQPLDWIALLGRKLLLAVNAVELVDTVDHYTFVRYSHLLRATNGLLHFGVLAPLALLGMWLTRAQWRRLWPLYGLLAAYGATLLLFYIFGRYRLPLVPILLLFAAAGVAALGELVRSRAWRELALALGLTAGMAVLANWPLLDERYMESVTRYNLANELAKLGLADRAIEEYEEAIELHADNALANHNLGVLLARKRKFGTAQRYIERALEIAPDYAEAHINLARVKLDSYDPAGAIESYRKGLALEPGQADVHVELGKVLLAQGDRAGAEQSFSQALAIDPQHQSARQALSELRGS